MDANEGEIMYGWSHLQNPGYGRKSLRRSGIMWCACWFWWSGVFVKRVVNYALQSVMCNFGISLLRTSRAQSAAGTAVSSSRIQPGAFVFYANGSGTVNHVALYIGGGQVVHASSRRTGIRISTWNYRTPSAIRRVV